MLRVRNVNLYLHRALQCNVVYVEVLVVLIIAYFHFTISSYMSSVITLRVWSNQQQKNSFNYTCIQQNVNMI